MFRNLLTKLQGAAILGLLLIPLGAPLNSWAQATEGYDPLLQISHQFAHPDLYIVQDKSGSMAWDIIGNTPGTALGTAPVLTWNKTTASCGTGVNLGKCKTYTYTLKNTQSYPTRMNTVKNALGSTTNIYTPWDPPATWPAFAVAWASGTVTGPVVTHTGTTHSYAWTVKYGSYVADPLAPFVAFDASGTPTIGSGGEYLAAQNLIGTTANVVNWGLITFENTTASLVRAVDSSDSGDASLVLASVNALTPGSGSTPTRNAIQKGEDQLQADFMADSKYTCGRTYAMVLVTDGLSNNNNPNDDNWGPCPCDAGHWTGADCPASYTLFPPGKSESAWNSTQTRGAVTLTRLRTWAIGISPNVNRCEMNMDAYMGRTDANSPNNDAGFGLDPATHLPLDPRLPQSTGDVSNYDPAGGDYAYFALTATALKDAFQAIVAAVAAGDYTTAAPVASSALGAGTVAILASTEFPNWKGHLWAFDTTKNPGIAGYVKWDAGWNLRYDKLPADDIASPWVPGAVANPAYVAPNNRLIYTWNPSTKAMVRISPANATTINTLCGSCGIDAGVVDFILGYDGTGTNTIRPWVLSSSINSTPAIVQSAEHFAQGNLEDHTTFEADNGGTDAGGNPNRVPMVWVGSDDGQLHGFKLEDGQEIVSLIPPNLLSKQVTLKNNYHVVKRPLGEPGMPSDHIYGVASSPKYGDMYFSGTTEYKTVMLLSEGPGGDLIAGIDVTNPVKNLATVNPPTPGGTPPVSVLWNDKGSAWTTVPAGPAPWSGLYNTWSTPAGGPSKKPASSSVASVWVGLTGWGFNAASTRTSPLVPKALLFDPTTGSLLGTPTSPSNVASPAPFVGNQTFSDSVIFSTTAKAFYPDNIVNLALQPDLNGRIWFMDVKNGTTPASATVGIDATSTKAWTSPYAINQQPIYYPCAVNSFETSGGYYDTYAFGSGTTYEISSKITGSTVGVTGATPSNFIPCLYVVIKGQGTYTTLAAADEILRIPIQEFFVPDDAHPLSGCGCPGDVPMCTPQRKTVGTYKQVYCTTSPTPTVHLGKRTQLSAPPALFIPVEGAAGNPTALFLVYDPDAVNDCAGKAYVVQVDYNVDASGHAVLKETIIYNAGSGAASGFAVAGNAVIIAKSNVGSGARAGITEVPGLHPTAGMSNPEPIWWRELK